MINTTLFMEELIKTGYEKVLCVPCSFLKYPINYAVNNNIYMPVANEGEAVAISAGMTLANKKSVVFMQNSGLSNAMSPLTSLNAIYNLQCLMIIGYRGSSPDEPQHQLMGKITEKLLEDMNIKYEIISSDTNEALAQVVKATKYIEEEHKMFCLLAKKDIFEKVELTKKQTTNASMLRFELLQILANVRDENTAIVTTTGFTSRELYAINNDPQNFYMVGSMGCASSIGLGLALAKPEKKIIVVEGDGAFFMRPSILPVLSAQKPNNLCHIVLSNETYESTGSQPLPATLFSPSQMMKLVYGQNLFVSENKEDFELSLSKFIANPEFSGIYADIRSECMPNLGRPTETSRELKEQFMASFN